MDLDRWSFGRRRRHNHSSRSLHRARRTKTDFRRFELLESRALLAVGIDLLKDINVVAGESGAENFALSEESFYFGGRTATGYGLFKSDGTTNGSYRVAKLPDRAVEIGDVDGTAYFSVNQPTTGIELWISDGTEGGTRLLKDLRPGPASSQPQWFTSYNGAALFVARDENSATNLWRSDGTIAGTGIVAPNITSIEHATILNVVYRPQ